MLRLFILRLVETYLRHRFLWLLPIGLMVAYAGYHYKVTKPPYISLAAVYINKETLLADVNALNQGGLAWVTPAQAAVDQIKELFQTDAFIRSVIQHTDLESEIEKNPYSTGTMIQSTRSSIWVSSLGNNTIVIGASALTPILAQQLADGAIEVFIQWKINTGQQATTAALSFYKDLVQSYAAEADAAEVNLKKFLDDHPVPVRGDRVPSEDVEIVRLQGLLSSANDRFKKAQDNLEASQLSEKVNESAVRQMYLIVDSPNFPNKAALSKKSVLTTSLIYVVVGVILSVVGVVVGTIVDSAVRFAEDITIHLQLPVFAIMPDWSAAKPKKAARKKQKEQPAPTSS